jgi:UrcA family protein
MKSSLPIVFAIGALAVFASAAQAAEVSQEITITGTRTKTIPYDFATRMPVKEVSVSASVPVDLTVLTLNSGVALLQYNVREAAQKACEMADPSAAPTSDSTVDCVHEAVRGAQPQIDALIARAKSEETARLREEDARAHG